MVDIIVSPAQVTLEVAPAQVTLEIGKGPTGAGLPTGGATGAMPAKKSASDFDMEWIPTGAVGLSLLALSTLTAGSLLLGAGAGDPSELATTAYGRSLLGLADAAAGRTALELGSLAVLSSITASQINDSTVTGRSLLTAADAAAGRSALGLATGDSPAFAGLTTTGDIVVTNISSATAALRSAFGNIARHVRYGYSASYVAVQVSDGSRGVGFGQDPSAVVGSQFYGDARDVFFARGSHIGCPNAAGTDWAWALRISGGSAVNSSHVVEIADGYVSVLGAAVGTPASGEVLIGGGQLKTAGAITAADDFVGASTSGYYFGDRLTDGTWRLRRDGSDLVLEHCQSGSYVEANRWVPPV